MSTDSNKRKDGPEHADEPVCKRFCADDADIVLRSAKTSAEDSPTKKEEPATLFRVKSRDLRRMSAIFEDMLELGQSAGASNDVIQLPEGAWVLERILQMNDRNIDNHPDLFTYMTETLLRLHRVAVKYELSATQHNIETTLRSAPCTHRPHDTD